MCMSVHKLVAKINHAAPTVLAHVLKPDALSTHTHRSSTDSAFTVQFSQYHAQDPRDVVSVATVSLMQVAHRLRSNTVLIAAQIHVSLCISPSSNFF